MDFTQPLWYGSGMLVAVGGVAWALSGRSYAMERKKRSLNLQKHAQQELKLDKNPSTVQICLPQDPLLDTFMAPLRFFLPCLCEIVYIVVFRLFLHALVRCHRKVSSQLSFPQAKEDLNRDWKAQVMSEAGEEEAGAEVIKQKVPLSIRNLAADEGFTSTLFHISSGGASVPSIVVKLSPLWTVAEQVTSIEQQQHLKEQWVAHHWRDMGCCVPRHFLSRAQPWTGEFLHVMEFLDGHEAGDQLVSLSLPHALDAVGEISRLHARYWNRVPNVDFKWPSGFDGLTRAYRLVALLGKHYFNLQKGATTLFQHDPKMLGALEHFLYSPPLTVVHGDLRSANVMFSKGKYGKGNEGRVPGRVPGATANRCCIIDWGGLMQGKGVFDVAYLIGTGMSTEMRREHEITILRHYHASLVEHGVDGEEYDFNTLVRDYGVCLWLSAALYAIPQIYDRGTVSDENMVAAKLVRQKIGDNLQSILADEPQYQKWYS